jgi:hypothetical protein
MSVQRKSSYITLVIVFVFSFVIIRSMSYTPNDFSESKSSEAKFHTEKELQKIKDIYQRGPIEPGEYFLHSFNCTGCHGYDSTGYANVDENGVDVNLVDDWRATMMALSAKDPFWRAKVSHEILVNPSHALDLQNKCTSCHAPMGHYTALFKGQSNYTLTDLYTDSLGLDGVSCLACHTIGTDGLGTIYSGNIPYDTTFHAYGPFTNPVTGPMQLYEGFTPAYSQHVSESRFCSPCHTLLTNSVDLSGNLTGRKFIEQATYHEWLNSTYAADEITCQSCHMPKTTDSIRIANNQFNLPKRFPFNKHKFQGGNAFMVKLMKQNKTALQLDDIPDKNFDTSINIIMQTLQQHTLNIDLINDSIANDTAYFSVKLINRAGHKFPSGYPSRRAIVQFVVTYNNNQDTLFKSGIFDANYEVQNINPVFEPHHDVINSSNQTQIYEMVMGDVNGNKTTVLARADTMLKDNRLVPEGFSTQSSVYDTTKIVLGIADNNFNKYAGGIEGSGWDIIHYHVPLNGSNPIINIYTKVYYQSVPPAYLTEMFSYNSPEIDNFKNLYLAADKTPVCVAKDSIININLSSFEQELTGINIWPNPTTDGWLYISWENNTIDKINIYSLNGQLVGTYLIDAALGYCKIQLPKTNTAYLIDIRSGYKRTIKKIIRN